MLCFTKHKNKFLPAKHNSLALQLNQIVDVPAWLYSLEHVVQVLCIELVVQLDI